MKPRDLQERRAKHYEFKRQRRERKKRLKRSARKPPAYIKADRDTATSSN